MKSLTTYIKESLSKSIVDMAINNQDNKITFDEKEEPAGDAASSS